jgi:uncharacterized RDD family membrane protein YckC
MPLPDPELMPEFYAWVPAKRLAAWAVDTLLILALTAVVLVATALLTLLILPVLYAAVNIAYRTVTLARWSATPGMALMAIELRDGRGLRLDAMTAFLHTLGYTVSVLLVPLQVASVALMLITRRRQGLTDLVLGTAMINRPVAG